jgi:adenylate kinase family enzyme
MSSLYVVTGPPGVGKSTVSKVLAESKIKSVLIEGDEIYHQVVGGYTPAWKEGNHLDIFWKICLNIIEIYLLNGYDVIFNYVVTTENLVQIKCRFKNYNMKFIILIVDEEILLKRDKQRAIGCQMNERCLILLNKFKNANYEKNYFLDSSNLSVTEVVETIEKNNSFFVGGIKNGVFRAGQQACSLRIQSVRPSQSWLPHYQEYQPRSLLSYSYKHWPDHTSPFLQ